jgi:hypothetical protein
MEERRGIGLILTVVGFAMMGLGAINMLGEGPQPDGSIGWSPGHARFIASCEIGGIALAGTGLLLVSRRRRP